MNKAIIQPGPQKVQIQGARSKALQKRRNLQLLTFTLPGLFWFVVFCYLPMLGMVMAFQEYTYRGGIFGSRWVGFKNFAFLFSSSDASRIFVNTILYNFLIIALTTLFAVGIAILFDFFIKRIWVKLFQTAMFLPYFISWVVVSYMALILFNFENGVLNRLVTAFGGEAVSWYMKPAYWRFILPFAGLWKGIGFSTVIYYAAVLGIDTELHGAAAIDGASILRRIWHITLPLLRPTIIILTIMSIGSIMRADFGLFYYLPNNSGALYATTDVIDTYIYRTLKVSGDISSSAAASFFQSVVGFGLILTTNFIVKKIDSESSLF